MLTRDKYGNKALEILEKPTGNLFLTGKAGTGKSTLINYFVENHPDKNILLMAPTGIAAQNIHGLTIHNALRFNINTTPATLPDISRAKANMLRAADIIIIDEISMVSAHIMDCIDRRLREVANWTEQFGGKKMVFVGDLFQLPPVIDGYGDTRVREIYDNTYTTRYFYGAKTFQEYGLDNWNVIELEHVYRQEESGFLEILNCIREGKQCDRVVDKINERVGAPLEHAITLTTTNRKAIEINKQKSFDLHKTFNIYLPSDFKLFDDAIREKEDRYLNMKIMKDLSPFEECVEIRHGDQIMITMNQPRPMQYLNDINRKPDYVNGDMGEFVAYKRGMPNVCYVKLFKDGKIRAITKQESTIEKPVLIGNKYEYEAIGIVRGYPFKRAYAITMHKSQGQTYDKAILDFERGPFECGQTYVALSRIKSFEGLSLVAPIKKEYIFADEDVITFLNDNKLILGNQ